MIQTTEIEWATKTWNPVTGCHAVSAGCDHCYALRFATRLRGRAGYPRDDPFAVTVRPKRLAEPFHLAGRQRIFVCSMGDLFHPDVPWTFIRAVMAVISFAGEHTFIVLTKRPEAMHNWFGANSLTACQTQFFDDDIYHEAVIALGKKDDGIKAIHDPGGRDREYEFHNRAIDGAGSDRWPLPNLILGISAENQKCLDDRLHWLMRTPAAARVISLEPLLEPVSPQLRPDGRNCIICGDSGHQFAECHHPIRAPSCRGLPDWIIVGGETGPGARPMHQAWVREIRDQCQFAGVPFFFKQWGEWVPWQNVAFADPTCRVPRTVLVGLDGEVLPGHADNVHPDSRTSTQAIMYRVGRVRAGRVLDGRTWDQFPETMKG